MNDAVRTLERPVRVCPMGVRFWDTVARRVVDDGLTVDAVSSAQPHRRVRAFTNRSGVYAFADLPGLRGYEFGLHEVQAPGGSPPLPTFVIEVEDAAGRFLPFQFETQPPILGLFRWESEPELSPLASPLGMTAEAPEQHVPLFPAPGRQSPTGTAAVRAELRERSGKPAAWAVLEVYSGGALLGRSYADERGLVAVMFAYPEPLGPALSSPGGGAKIRLADHEWPLQFVVRYEGLPPLQPGRRRAGPLSQPSYPDLNDALRQRPAVVELDLSPPEPLTGADLRFGRDLILRSQNAPPQISHLLITPAASPP